MERWKKGQKRKYKKERKKTEEYTVSLHRNDQSTVGPPVWETCKDKLVGARFELCVLNGEADFYTRFDDFVFRPDGTVQS